MLWLSQWNLLSWENFRLSNQDRLNSWIWTTSFCKDTHMHKHPHMGITHIHTHTRAHTHSLIWSTQGGSRNSPKSNDIIIIKFDSEHKALLFLKNTQVFLRYQEILAVEKWAVASNPTCITHLSTRRTCHLLSISIYSTCLKLRNTHLSRLRFLVCESHSPW